MVFTDQWSLQVHHQSEILKKKRIVPGCLCKISNGEERFYVQVALVKKNGVIVGKVDNVLLIQRPYKYCDLVAFEKKHCIEIFTIEDRYNRERECADTVAKQSENIISNYILENGRHPTKEELFAYYEFHRNVQLF